MRADMRHRVVDVADNFGGNDHIKIFAAPIVVICSDNAVDALQSCIAAHFDTGVDQRADHALTKGIDHTVVDQKALGRTANTCAPGFGVKHDIQRFLRISGSVDIDVHNTFQMRKDRHARFALHQPDKALATALTPAGIGGYPQAEVMAFKYGKLVLNLGNIAEAALGREVDAGDISERLRAEGRAVLDAAQIDWRDVYVSDPRRDLMKNGTVEGVHRLGGSTSQSLARAAGSVETDFLNGEICYLGRLHGIATPANDFVTRLAARMARDKSKTGTMTFDELARGVGL